MVGCSLAPSRAGTANADEGTTHEVHTISTSSLDDRHQSSPKPTNASARADHAAHPRTKAPATIHPDVTSSRRNPRRNSSCLAGIGRFSQLCEVTKQDRQRPVPSSPWPWVDVVLTIVSA